MFKTAQEVNRGFIHKQFTALWQRSFKFHDDCPDAEELIESLQNLEESDLTRTEIVMVFSMEDFEPLYFSKNVEQVLGHPVEELLKSKSFLFFKLLAFNQISTVFQIIKWVKAFWSHKKTKASQSQKMETYYCGIQTKPINGKSKTFLIRNSYKLGQKQEFPKTMVFYFTDITHLFRGDFYWVIFRSTWLNGKFSKIHSSRITKKESYNLITEREKEILLKFSDGKSNKEIGECLEISTGTVEKHRRNMLEKTGARDTTALIHFCKLCKIL